MNTSHGNLTLPTIVCCICGISMQTNPTNMCASCLHDRVDVTAEINKKLTIHSCRSCGRFLGPPWQEVDLESKELLVMCLRKINGLHKIKLVDAAWIWTEPHSMRLKIKLTVQKEISAGAYLQQSTVAEFVIRNQQCKHCEASYATGAWHAIVQVRQRVTHKRTFFYLEQLMLKHEAHKECVKIVTFRDGIDFYFKEKNQALRFIDFLEGVVPTKNKYSRKLISADKKANTAEYKHNYMIDIAPLCKDDLVLLPKELAAKQSNISPVVLVKRVAASIFVIDPHTGEKTDINSEKYWRYSFNSLLTSRELTKYYVLSVEPILADHRPSARMKRVSTTQISSEDQQRTKVKQSIAHASKLAEVVIVRDRDLGKNDTQFTVVTHLGPLLSPGDYVLGYDLTSTNFNIDEDGKKTLARIPDLPDVILVRKSYDKKERIWELKKLEDEVDVEGNALRGDIDHDRDMEDFMQQVEADREMRQHINLYKRKDIKAKKVTIALGKKGSSASAKSGSVKSSMKSKSSNQAQEDDDEDEDAMDDEENEDSDEDYESLDDEEVRLEDLLDDMSLNSDLEEEEREVKVLNADEAAKASTFQLETPSHSQSAASVSSPSAFNPSNFDPTAFKFV